MSVGKLAPRCRCAGGPQPFRDVDGDVRCWTCGSSPEHDVTPRTARPKINQEEIAQLRRDLRFGCVDPVDVILRTDVRIKVYDMLKAVPGLSKRDAATLFALSGQSPSRRIPAMTRTDREWLAQRLSAILRPGLTR